MLITLEMPLQTVNRIKPPAWLLKSRAAQLLSRRIPVYAWGLDLPSQFQSSGKVNTFCSC